MTVSAPVYLDYAATTPVDPAVAAAMTRSLTGPDGIGNASSVTHVFGRRAAEGIERSRAQVAELIGAAAEEIVFTSGATESNNLAILGAARASAYRGRHIVSSRIEHKAVLDPLQRLAKEGFAVTLVSPDRRGRIDPDAVAAALRPDTVLASIMLVNNEVGVIQDVAAIAALCRARGVLLHSDAAQAAGKIPLDVHALPVDFVAVTAHKMYGPKGIGALYVRAAARAHLQAILFGGGQERGLRPGTAPTHQIVGFGVACDLARRELTAEHARLAGLRDRLWQGLADLGGVHANGEGAPCVPGILNVSFEGIEGESLVAGLPELAVSTGSACNSASAEPSYVLRALGRDMQLAQSSLRLSFGRFSGPEHIATAVAAIRREVTRLRALSPASESLGEAAGEAGAPGDGRPEGEASPGAGPAVGEAGGPGQEVWVRFRLRIAGGVVKSALFKAYGCPHTLAVAAWVTERLRGRSRADLAPGTPAEWAEALAIPVEKLGRLLVIEDALVDCARHWPLET
ncbi:MAG TPA: aminotransferase class V-fold PLP-dependent enzyme [Steroidobacteraceae bacterium]|nr:aminotransferase class V-fold PLP-dependent enzyme [Steroidobacteraceae bacterium]